MTIGERETPFADGPGDGAGCMGSARVVVYTMANVPLISAHTAHKVLLTFVCIV